MTVTTANCGTVTPRGTYPLVITGTDGSGSALEHATTVSLAVTNGSPTVSGPVSTLYAGTRLGASSINVRTRWSACDPDGTAASRAPAPGQRRDVEDRLVVVGDVHVGHAGPRPGCDVPLRGPRGRPAGEHRAVRPRALVQVHVDRPGERRGPLRRAPGRRRRTGPPTAGARATRGQPAQSATYTFTGSSIAWVSSRGPTRGSADVYVDGVRRATVSLYSSEFSARATVFAYGWATSGTHTIRIVVAGTPGHRARGRRCLRAPDAGVTRKNACRGAAQGRALMASRSIDSAFAWRSKKVANPVTLRGSGLIGAPMLPAMCSSR